MSDVMPTSVLIVGMFIGLMGLTLSGVAVWQLRSVIPLSGEEHLETEVMRLRNEVKRLQSTVDTLVRNLSDNQRDFEAQKTRDQEVIGQLQHQNQLLEQKIAALTGRSTASDGKSVNLTTKLRSLLTQHLNADELACLAADVGVDLKDLGGGSSKEAQALTLITYMAKRDKLAQLIETLRQMRSDVKWDL